MGNELARLATALLDRLDTYEESCFYREERGALRAHLAAAGDGGSGVERRAAEAIRSAFFTSVSGEKPHRYHLSLAYPTMEAMHAAEDAIKAWALAVLEGPSRTLPSTQDEADVERVAAILEEWDMKPPPNACTGHSYQDIARSILAAMPLTRPDGEEVL